MLTSPWPQNVTYFLSQWSHDDLTMWVYCDTVRGCITLWSKKKWLYPRTKVGGIWDQRSLRVRRVRRVRVRVRRHFLCALYRSQIWTDCFHIRYGHRLWQDLNAYCFWARSEIQDGRRRPFWKKNKDLRFSFQNAFQAISSKKNFFFFFPHLKNFSGLDLENFRDFFFFFFFFFFPP